MEPPFPRTLHHVGIAVPSLDGARALYERLEGARGSPVEELPDQGVRVQFIGAVELLEPLGADTPVGRFLARRGPGIHHVAWAVTDLAGTLRTLEADGMELIDREPRIGAGGHQVAFLHPQSTGGTLVELVEATPHSHPTPTGSG